jgi:hypothetical protein
LTGLLWTHSFEAPNLFPTKNEIKIIWLHICPVLDCLLLYDRTGWWNHMIIASVKVLLLFSIVDIISNCQTVIIDNYTKNKDRLFEWNEYNFDDIDKLMLKRKADDEFKIIVLKQIFFFPRWLGPSFLVILLYER